ncbi:MAG: hypothetical protein QXT20_02695 [Candidatus Woesearchaeota archaeon]
MRGIARDEIVLIILALTAAAVIAYIFIQNNWLSESAERELCRVSVLSRWASTKIAADSLFDLQCKSHLKRISYSDIEEIKGESAQKDAIKQIIADEMYDCWYKFNRGQLKLDNVFKVITDPNTMLGTREVCMVCSQIEFDDEIKNKFPTIDKFTEWMMNNKVPGQDFTYFQYFSNDQQVDRNAIKAIPPEYDSIKTDETYQVIFKVYERSKVNYALDILRGVTPSGVLMNLYTQSYIQSSTKGISNPGGVVPTLLVIPLSGVPESCKRFY